MLKLFDTSVVVAALSEAHAMHKLARPHLEDALGGNTQMAVSAHALAEVYSTELLTFNGRDFRRMPPRGDTKLVVL